MAKKFVMSKRSMSEVRDKSYKERSFECCANCLHGWFYISSKVGSCGAIEVRGELVSKAVTPNSKCDLYQTKEKTNEG